MTISPLWLTIMVVTSNIIFQDNLRNLILVEWGEPWAPLCLERGIRQLVATNAPLINSPYAFLYRHECLKKVEEITLHN